MSMVKHLVVSYPMNDIHRHQYGNPKCRCKPDVQFIYDSLIICHRAFDKREFLEEVGITSKKKRWATKEYQLVEPQTED